LWPVYLNLREDFALDGNEKVGARIKRLREGKSLSIDELSARSALSVDFLHEVEEDNVYPSLGPLLKIARVLGIRLGTLLDDQISQDPLIMRVEDRREELTMLKGKDKPVALKFHSLGRGKKDRHMEPFYIEILPEPIEDKKLSSHEGEEFIVVLSGEVEIFYGQETCVLKQGDSVYYNSVIPHYVSCRGDRAEIYAVLYFPD
jgi:transcriptional regulator with XRE-family HTH domain